MIVAIVSDIHGNLNALNSVLDGITERSEAEAIICLGDLIDYGPNSNECIRLLKDIQLPVICNIWGNHEHAIMMEDYTRFSSERGKDCAKRTRSLLDAESTDYLQNSMQIEGRFEFQIGAKRCLAVHGNILDCYWKSIFPDTEINGYENYDYVFSGHSHEPHCFEKYCKIDDPIHRDRHKTIFINPGSVGQPRNINPLSQYAILNTETEEIQMLKTPYDIDDEQRQFSLDVDSFYRDRLSRGV